MDAPERVGRTKLEAFLARFYTVRFVQNFQAVVALVALLLLLVFTLLGWTFAGAGLYGFCESYGASAREVVGRCVLYDVLTYSVPLLPVGGAVLLWWWFVGAGLEEYARRKSPKPRSRRAAVRTACRWVLFFWGVGVICALVITGLMGAMVVSLGTAGNRRTPVEVFTYAASRLTFPPGIRLAQVPLYELPVVIGYFDATRWVGPLGGAILVLVYLLFLSSVALLLIKLMFRSISREGPRVGAVEATVEEAPGKPLPRHAGAVVNAILAAVIAVGMAFTAFVSYEAVDIAGMMKGVSEKPFSPGLVATRVAPGGSAVALVVGGGSRGRESLQRALLVYRPAAEGNRVKPLLRTEDLLMGKPLWHPAGDRLMVEVTRMHDYYKWLLSVDAQTGEIKVLKEGQDQFYLPSWSPDGKYVAYANLSEKYEIYGGPMVVIIDAETGKEVRRFEEASTWNSWAWGDSGTILWSCGSGALSTLDVETGETKEFAPGMRFVMQQINQDFQQVVPVVAASRDGAVLTYLDGIHLAKTDGASWTMKKLAQPPTGVYRRLPKVAWNDEGTQAITFVEDQWEEETTVIRISAEGGWSASKYDGPVPREFGLMADGKLLCRYCSEEGGDVIGILDLETGEAEDLLHLRAKDASALFEAAKGIPPLKLVAAEK